VCAWHNRGIASHFFSTLALDGVCDQPHTLAALLSGIMPSQYLLNRDLGGPCAPSEHFGEGKAFLPLLGIEPQLHICPAPRLVLLHGP